MHTPVCLKGGIPSRRNPRYNRDSLVSFEALEVDVKEAWALTSTWLQRIITEEHTTIRPRHQQGAARPGQKAATIVGREQSREGVSMSRGKFVQSLAVRFLTHFILRIRGFLLIPIIAKLLGVTEYGIWTQLNISTLLLVPVLTLKLDLAAAHYLSATQEKDHLSRVIFSMLALTVITCLLFCVLGFIFQERLAVFILGNASGSTYLMPFLLLVPVVALRQFTMNYYWVFSRIARYSVLEVLENIGLVVTVVLTIVLFAAALTLVLWSLVAFEAIIAAYLLLSISGELGITLPRLSILKPYLKYSMPLIPSGILMWTIYFSDRYVITHFLGLDSVAIYSIAYALGSITAFALAPVSFVLLPHISHLWNQGKTSQVRAYLERSMLCFLVIAIPSAVGIVSLTAQLFSVFAGETLIIPSLLVPLVSTGAVLHGIYQILMYVLHLSEKTTLIFLWVLLAAGTNLILNIVFAPRFWYGCCDCDYTCFISNTRCGDDYAFT